jgi:hypothetical protein
MNAEDAERNVCSAFSASSAFDPSLYADRFEVLPALLLDVLVQ